MSAYCSTSGLSHQLYSTPAQIDYWPRKVRAPAEIGEDSLRSRHPEDRRYFMRIA